jgi:hypothetical protein
VEVLWLFGLSSVLDVYGDKLKRVSVVDEIIKGIER